MSMNLDEISIGDARKLASMFQPSVQPGKSHSIPLGKNVFIRGGNFYYTGRVASITDSDIVLEDAAWIPVTDRFHTMLKTGSLDEVEPFTHPVIIPRDFIQDITTWSHNLPREQK